MNPNLLRNNDLGLLIMRVALGCIMLLHGIHKLVHGIDGIAGMLASMGLPSFIAYGVIIGEVVAPIMLILGLFTRAGAFVYAFNMVVAVLMAHSADVFSINPATGGWAIELPALYFFMALVLVFTGGGKYSLTRPDGKCAALDLLK